MSKGRGQKRKRYQSMISENTLGRSTLATISIKQRLKADDQLFNTLSSILPQWMTQHNYVTQMMRDC